MSDSIRRSARSSGNRRGAVRAAIGVPTLAATGGLPLAGLVAVGLAVVGRVALDFGLGSFPDAVMALTRSLSQRLGKRRRETPALP